MINIIGGLDKSFVSEKIYYLLNRSFILMIIISAPPPAGYNPGG